MEDPSPCAIVVEIKIGINNEVVSHIENVNEKYSFAQVDLPYQKPRYPSPKYRHIPAGYEGNSDDDELIPHINV